MSNAIAFNAPVNFWPDRAQSEVANEVERQLQAAIDTERSAAFGKRHWDLDAVRAECALDNWDGYGAKAVSLTTYRVAKSFLSALPRALPDPEVAADADGEIVFAWRRSPRELFTMTISPQSRVSYAALRGTESDYGTKVYLGSVPHEALDHLARLFPTGAEAA